MRALRGVLLAGAIVGASVPSARGQDAATAEGTAAREAAEREARERFEHGTALVEEGRFAEAAVELEAALALSPRPPIAFNLALAQRGIGAFVEGTATCEGLLSERYGPLDDARRPEAEELCAEIAASVARLTVRAASEEEVEARLDGASLGAIGAGESLDVAVDPGAHVVALETDGGGRAEAAITLSPGEHRAIELDPVLPEPAGAAAPPSGDVAIGVGVGFAGGVVLVVAIVVVAVLATAPATGPPAGDLPVTATLVAF